MNICESIKTIRKQKGISQKQLAEQTGLSVNAIQDFEYGKYKPKIQQVQKIANALGVHPSQIDSRLVFETNSKTLQDYSTKELLKELERRCVL